MTWRSHCAGNAWDGRRNNWRDESSSIAWTWQMTAQKWHERRTVFHSQEAAPRSPTAEKGAATTGFSWQHVWTRGGESHVTHERQNIGTPREQVDVKDEGGHRRLLAAIRTKAISQVSRVSSVRHHARLDDNALNRKAKAHTRRSIKLHQKCYVNVLISYIQGCPKS